MPYPHIVRNRKIFGGKPVIKGTRLSVEFILELMASGMSVQEMIKEYPNLSDGLVREALAYAATDLKRSEVELRVEAA